MMSKIIDAQDLLADARDCVECIFLAATNIGEETDPIQAVANIASEKITVAIALLDEYRGSGDAGPEPDAPSVKPGSPAWPVWRTERKGK